MSDDEMLQLLRRFGQQRWKLAQQQEGLRENIRLAIPLARDAGLSTETIAFVLGIDRSTLYRVYWRD